MSKILFRLRFGLGNSSNTFKREKNNTNVSIKCVLIEFAIPNLNIDFIYSNTVFKTGFGVQNIHLEFSTFQYKFKWIFFTEKLVLTASFPYTQPKFLALNTYL